MTLSLKNITLNYTIIICLILPGTRLLSQESTQNINNPEDIVRYVESGKDTNNQDSNNAFVERDTKCGLWLSFNIIKEWNKFSELQKTRLRLALSPTPLDRDTIIGRFDIHFDTSGYHEPALIDVNHQRMPNSWRAYVDSVGKYFNHAWNYMTDTLGYSEPPFESGQSYYHIYIEELGADYYGETRFVDLLNNTTPSLYTTYIRIDNDYIGFKSEGISGLKVTSAHEFHHAIQIGRYGLWSDELYYYEITSTWMEDVLYDDVNDYYQYLKDDFTTRKGHFIRPDVSFTSSSPLVSYSRAIWGKFIEKRFSRDLIRESWDYVRSEHTLSAIDHALTNAGSTFRNAFLEWTIWNYNTGPYSDTLRYYSEGRNYPSIVFRPSIEYKNEPRSFTDTIEVISSVYHPICLLSSASDNCDLSPQLVAIISNLNTAETSGKKVGFSYEISNTGGPEFTELSNGIFVRLNAPDLQNWVSQESVPTIVSSILTYPNPFYPKGSKSLYLRLPAVKQSTATLYIYSASMDRIAAKEIEVISQDFEPRIEWDGRDMNGNIVPTGVYIYVVAIDGKQFIGKLAVIKE